MTSGLEAVGDAATGAVLAHAVEPDHGGTGDKAHGACLNCGTMLTGPYCHACGQNSHLHRTISGFLHDLLHGVFHFEGKIWETLPMLLFHPGALTRRYIAGERAKFVSPMAMFLFCVFLMFAVVGSLAGEMHLGEDGEAGRGVVVNGSAEALKKEIDDNARQIRALETRIGTEKAAGRVTVALQRQVDALKEEQAGLDTAVRIVPKITIGDRPAGKVNTGWPALNQGIRKASENPNLFLYRLQSSAYKYSWLLIPISTPLLWLLFFWKRQYKVYDHLVFVTFSLTFMMLLVTLLTLLGAAGLGESWIIAAVLIIPPLHMYRQMRGAYLGSRIGSVLRTVLLVMMGGIALILYLMVLLAMGVFH
ncbi:MAG: DUF3667 domain-containing protein [Tardiphaga sp.]